MPKTYTSDELLNSLRNLGYIGNAGTTGSMPADALQVLTEAMRDRLVPEVMMVKENYFLVSTRIPLSSVTNRYRVPTRAIGNKINIPFYFDGTQRFELTELEPDELYQWDTTVVSDPTRFYIEGNYFVLVPTPSTGFLEVSFFFRPGDLVPVAEAVQVTGVDLVTKKVNLPALPVEWTLMSLSDLIVDVHSKHSGAEIKVWDAAITDLNGGNGLTFTAAIDGSTFGTHPVEVGDWVCLAGEAVIPALPKDLHPALIRAAAMQYAEQQGDSEGLKTHLEQYKLDIRSLKTMVAPRIEGKPYFLRQAGGFYRQGRRW